MVTTTPAAPSCSAVATPPEVIIPFALRGPRLPLELNQLVDIVVHDALQHLVQHLPLQDYAQQPAQAVHLVAMPTGAQSVIRVIDTGPIVAVYLLHELQRVVERVPDNGVAVPLRRRATTSIRECLRG